MKEEKREVASNAELQARINNMAHVPSLRTTYLSNPKKFSSFNKNSRYSVGKFRATTYFQYRLKLKTELGRISCGDDRFPVQY
jgi:hypothetical protein